MSGLEGRLISITAGDRLIVDGVDCTVPRGSFTALVGPNGAGKTTLLRTLAAVHPPLEGTVELDGADLNALGRRSRARLVAFVEQDANTESALTVEMVVSLGRLPFQGLWRDDDPESRAIVAGAIASVGMTDFTHREFQSLSGGERQRVMFARALAQQPSLLVLDEPTNHLDIGAQLEVLGRVRGLAAEGMTVIAALHDLGHAATYADHVIVLADGRVVAAGPTAETLTPELIRAVYGVEAAVLTHPVTGQRVLAFSPLI